MSRIARMRLQFAAVVVCPSKARYIIAYIRVFILKRRWLETITGRTNTTWLESRVAATATLRNLYFDPHCLIGMF